MSETTLTTQDKAEVRSIGDVKVLEVGNPDQVRPKTQNQRSFSRLYPYFLAANAALGTLYFGYILADFNIINDFVSSYAFDEEVHKIVLNFMTSFVPLGAAIGAVMAGKIVAMIGRRKSMFVIDFLSLIGTVLTLLPSQYSLLAGRLLQGYTVGANSSIVPLYIRETAPAEIAARVGTGTQLSICTGTLLAPIIGLGMPLGLDINPENQYFRIVLAVAGIPPLIRILLNFTVFRFETPRYLVTKDKDTQALAVLKKIYTPNRAQEELTALKTEKEIMMRGGNKVTIKEIFSNKYRRRLLVGVMMSIFQQFSGINAIIFYSNKIFSQGITDEESHTPTVYTIIMNLVQIVAVIVSGIIVERVGRKLLSFIGMALVTVVISAFGIVCLFVSDSPVLKFFIWGYMIGFGLSVGSLLWVILADILPDIGMGIATFVNWMCAFIVGLTFPVMVDDIGIAWTFIIFGGFGLLGTLFIAFFLKETKGKTEAEIMELYAPKNRNRS